MRKVFVPQTSQVRTCGRSCGRQSTIPIRAGSGTDVLALWRSLVRTTIVPVLPQRGRHLQARLRTIGVLNAKLHSYRLPALLRDPAASDACRSAGYGWDCHERRAIQFSVTSKRLADDVFELIASLGYRCHRRPRVSAGGPKESSTAYILNFSTDDDVFQLPRKALAHKERRTSNAVRSSSRFITDVRPIPSVPVRCVEVDNADHLYLVATR